MLERKDEGLRRRVIAQGSPRPAETRRPAQAAEAFTLWPGFAHGGKSQSAAQAVRRGDEIHLAKAGAAELVRTIHQGPAERALRGGSRLSTAAFRDPP